jgi:hypothetical protein
MNTFGTTVLFVLLLAVSTAAPALDVTDEIVAPARDYLGGGYCFGSATPSCFDCSGFVSYLYRPHVPDLPRSSRAMARFGDPVGLGELRPGDLLFFATGPDPNVISHVAIYIGQDSIIHAVSDGPERGVTITPLSARYWSRRVHSARRVLPVAAPAEPAPDRDRTREPLRFAKGTYTGELRDGEPHGEGVLRLNNGDRYEGRFAGGLFHGEGTYTWADGRRYSGRFENGRIAEAGARDTYLEERDSPWNEFDGVVRGDFAAWWDDEQRAFEQWKEEQQNF